jgi:two-component system, sensor histidine kinase
MALNFSNLELKGKNIVIVDDDLFSIIHYQAILKKSGADIIVFRNGREFVEYLEQENENIDLVFMDFLIPLINGIECTKIFRKHRKGIPVIMITAYSSEQARTDALIAECTEYLLKPVYPEKVFYLLEKYLKTNPAVTTSY